MTVTDIVEQAKALSIQERKLLIKLLVDGLDRQEMPAQPRSITELRGLGKTIWQGIDAQDYVNELRNEWDRQ